MDKSLISALSDLKEREALEIVRQRLDAGDDPRTILADARSALEIVGERFQNGDYFIPDLVFSGEILKEITNIVRPNIVAAANANRLGKIVIGTVAGDIHDIGKDIVTFLLDVNGFEVVDLGVDVPPRRFVEKIEETGATVLGLSGLLTVAFDSMKETVQAFAEAGLRAKTRIMIGGGQVDDEIRKYTGADAYGSDAMAAVSLAREWLGSSLRRP